MALPVCVLSDVLPLKPSPRPSDQAPWRHWTTGRNCQATRWSLISVDPSAPEEGGGSGPEKSLYSHAILTPPRSKGAGQRAERGKRRAIKGRRLNATLDVGRISGAELAGLATTKDASGQGVCGAESPGGKGQAAGRISGAGIKGGQQQKMQWQCPQNGNATTSAPAGRQ